MKPFRMIALATALVSSAYTQKIEMQKADPSKVIRVATAKDHLTVIEFADAVTMVAVGNRSAFTVERRENKVFVTPSDDAARTNLFIWTSGGRYAYELVPAAEVDQMHFVIDQAPVPVIASTLAPSVRPERLPSEMLTDAIPVLVTGERDTVGRVEITIRDLYRKDGRLYVRYALQNRTSASYAPVRPASWLLEGPKAQQSLMTASQHQLGERLARSVKSDAETAMDIFDADQVPVIAPGGLGWGWLVLRDAGNLQPGSIALIRMQFAADAKGALDAILVLPPAQPSEVARVRRTVE